MNGIHDMGGMDGFGPVDPDESGPVFHGKWEGQVMAASRVMGAVGAWNIDQGRYGIEQLPPHRYLTSYYHRWLARCESAFVKTATPIRTKSPPAIRFAPARRRRAASSPSPTSTASAGAGPSPGRSRAGAVRGRAIASREERASQGPYPAAALRSRSCRHGRAAARLPGLPRQRGRARAKTRNGSTPFASKGATCGAPMPIRRQGLGRGVRALSGSGRHDRDRSIAAKTRARGQSRSAGRRAKAPCSASRGRRRPSP